MPDSPDLARVKTHLKAIIEETKRMSDELNAGTGPDTAKVFVSGMLTGLAAAARITTGTSAEDAMETVVTGIEASIGRAYLDGNLTQQEK